MFCPKCGENLPDNATFCGNCGNKIEGAQAQSASTPKASPLAGNKKGVIAIVAIVVIVLIVAIAIGVFALSGGSSSSSSAPSSPSSITSSSSSSSSSSASSKSSSSSSSKSSSSSSGKSGYSSSSSASSPKGQTSSALAGSWKDPQYGDTMTLSSDGTAVITQDGRRYSGTWKATSNGMVFDMGNKSYSFVLGGSGNKKTLYNSDKQLYFEKTN